MKKINAVLNHIMKEASCEVGIEGDSMRLKPGVTYDVAISIAYDLITDRQIKALVDSLAEVRRSPSDDALALVGINDDARYDVTYNKASDCWELNETGNFTVMVSSDPAAIAQQMLRCCPYAGWHMESLVVKEPLFDHLAAALRPIANSYRELALSKEILEGHCTYRVRHVRGCFALCRTVTAPAGSHRVTYIEFAHSYDQVMAWMQRHDLNNLNAFSIVSY